MGREFDRFLFATIGDDRHGQPLSVVSALARSDLDPWREAAALTLMSRRAATARLTGLISALPGEPTSKLPIDPIARELVALLPHPNPSAIRASNENPASRRSENKRAGLGLSALVVLTTIALMMSAPPSPRPYEKAGALASTAPSSHAAPFPTVGHP